MTISLPLKPTLISQIDGNAIPIDGGERSAQEIQFMILNELRIQTHLLHALVNGQTVLDDPVNLRADVTNDPTFFKVQ